MTRTIRERIASTGRTAGRAINKFMRQNPEFEMAPGQADAAAAYPLSKWPEPWNTGHHFETGADGIVRAVADTPEIAARDERYHQAASEFREQTGFYVAPDGWDTDAELEAGA